MNCLLDIPNAQHGTSREAICYTLLQKALGGDIEAFKIIRDTVGEKPTIQIDSNIEQHTIVIDQEKLKEMNELLRQEQKLG